MCNDPHEPGAVSFTVLGDGWIRISVRGDCDTYFDVSPEEFAKLVEGVRHD